MKNQFGNTAYRSCLLWGICSSMSVAACTFIDALLIGNFVGSDGLAVSGIMTPVFLLFSLLGVTVAMGANVLISREIGSSNTKEANRVMGMQLSTGFIMSAVLLVSSLIFRNEILSFLGAEGQLFSYAKDYLIPVFIASPMFIMYQILAFSVRSDGNSKLSAASSALVIFLNLTLDLLFMGVLDFGIKGASIALCIAETLGAALLLLHFRRKNASLRLKPMFPELEYVKQFVKNGFGMGSAFIFQAFIMLVFNRLLLDDTENGVINMAVFSVLYTISTIPVAFYDGAGGAFAPVVPFFSGEKDGASMMAVQRYGLKFTAIVIAVFTVFFMVLAEPIVVFFGIDADYASYSAAAFRIFTVSLAFMGINSLMTAFWQTVGRSKLATIMSISRNLALILAFGLILIPRYGVKGLALAYVLSEALCFIFVSLVGIISPSHKFISETYYPIGRMYEKFYIIRKESIPEVSEDIEKLCEQWKIGPKQMFFMNFIVEEMILNIIKFGLSDSSKDHYIDMKILENGDEYILRIRDDIKSYNPFESNGDDLDNAVLTVIQKKSKYCEYSRKLVFNYLYLII